ncbi:histidine phosphatase family protein [Oligoflexus tunisiensis]|uniref:histidine phosphatase family protein n=1 Tax=Oligoflexus tunisiensis TaxID=708132 RepID=UPI00114D3306|nr:histidine phosphatase family protein [Oligoflexus tunisiensis]
MTIFYLLRHAESAPSHELKESQWPLSVRGQDQAEKLVPVLQDLRIQHIYSSPYLRAQQTVHPFSQATRLPVKTAHDLRERHFSDGLIDNFLEIMEHAWSNLDFCLPGCESGQKAQNRVRTCLDRLLDLHRSETLLLSSHGNLIGLLLKSLVPEYGFSNWRRMRNPDLFRLIVTDSGVTWDQGFRFEL